MDWHHFCLWIIVQMFMSAQIVMGLNGPAELNVISSNETEIQISWSPVSYAGITVEGYSVQATPVHWHSARERAISMELRYPNTTNHAQLIDLYPGTQYSINVTASTSKGFTTPTTRTAWTEIGAPEVPPSVHVVKRDGAEMEVELQPGVSDKGPVSGIQVVVLEKTSIVSFNEEQLSNFTWAQEQGLPFYLAALLPGSNVSTVFTVGDGQFVGGYYNAPLDPEADYEVLEGIISSFNGVTKVTYSPLQANNDNQHIIFTVDPQEFGESALTKVLAIAVGVFGFLLAASVLLYFLLRKHYGKRRPSDEMVLHDQITETEENGFIGGGMVQLGEDTNLSEFWELLRERYWQIPPHLLEISDQVLGQGHFGQIRKAVLHRRGKPVSVAVQSTQGQVHLPDSEKRVLFSEIDALLRLGSHNNLAEFLGICEDKGFLHLVAEHQEGNLRGLLLRSRQHNEQRFCSLSEHFLLELALRIADAMKYLTDHGVYHKHLSSRSVAIVDGYLPKVTNFGLHFYHPAGKKLDYSRWMAPEAGRTRNYTLKSDVWSFGVLLWEICTIGGTPFVEIPNMEIYARVVRGLRLQQPAGVSDELFQLMLHCWELDQDERPSFQELVSVLQNMAGLPLEQIRLETVSGFQFSKFDPKADEQ